MRRLAVLSLHTSPLAQPAPGRRGMNVYVRELTSALARSDVTCDVFTRAWSPDLPPVVDVEPGLRCTTSRPAAAGAGQGVAPRVVDEFTRASWNAWSPRRRPAPALHVGARQTTAVGYFRHAIKHELNLPLVCTFHTLDRVKAETMPRRWRRHAAPPGRSRGVHHQLLGRRLASCTVEADQIASLYGGEPGRIRIVPRGGPRLLRSGHRRKPAAPSVCRSTGGSSSSSGASSRSSVPTWRSRRWPS